MVQFAQLNQKNQHKKSPNTLGDVLGLRLGATSLTP